jgi:hypothetical protein
MMLLGFKSQSMNPCSCSAPSGHLRENPRDLRRSLGRKLIQRRAVHQLHHQRRFRDLPQQRLVHLHVKNTPHQRIVDLLADLVLVDQLLGKPRLLVGLHDDVLERENLLRRRIAHRIDQAAGAFPEKIHHVVAEQLRGRRI